MARNVFSLDRVRSLLHGRRGALFVAAVLVAAAVLGVVVVLWSRAAGGSAGPPAPVVRAWAAVVMDRSTGVVLYAKQPDERLPMASLTKIMTAMLVFERTRDLDSWVTVPFTAVGQPGARLGLATGDRITVRNLLRGLMLRSATDCAITLATAVAGDEPSFVALMNQRAAELGLANTHYMNCSGVNVTGHYSCARDLAELGRVAMRDPRFRRLVAHVEDTVTWPPHHVEQVHSHNELQMLYSWVDGIKTGATHHTGCCLVASGKYGPRRLIVATLRQPNRDQEVRDALRLFKYGASLYQRTTLVRRGQQVTELPLQGGGSVALVAGSTLTRMVRKAASVKVKLRLPSSPAAAPVVGAPVGRALYWADGVLLGAVTLRAPASAAPAVSATASATPSQP